MKYIVVLCDGMSDYPVPELGNKTPLQAAKKPGMDFIARHGVIGLAATIPPNVATGSDTANMAVMGFDPGLYYTGRSPIEAVSMGIALGDEDIAYRCNLVTLSDAEAYEDKIMEDYSSDEITSEEAAVLIEGINEWLLGEAPRAIGGQLTDFINFYAGISYRHCMIWHGGGLDAVCTPPHDILTRRIGDYLPSGGNGGGAGSGGGEAGSGGGEARILYGLMKESHNFLSKHQVNLDRAKRGLRPANSLWLWGQGRRLSLPSFAEKYNMSGAVISAVDLIKGIGISAGMRSIDVEGATGTLNTNYRGKAEAALGALDDGCDYVYIHIEAPDECGHRQEIDNKVKSIEFIDEHIVSFMLERLAKQTNESYSILVIPDHATPLSLRTHTRDPVPFAIYNSAAHKDNAGCGGFDEVEAAKSGLSIDPGHTLMEKFLRNTLS